MREDSPNLLLKQFPVFLCFHSTGRRVHTTKQVYEILMIQNNVGTDVAHYAASRQANSYQIVDVSKKYNFFCKMSGFPEYKTISTLYSRYIKTFDVLDKKRYTKEHK